MCQIIAICCDSSHRAALASTQPKMNVTAMTQSIYVFDAYGTLLDVNSAVAQHAAAIGPDAARLSELWRAKQLEYSWVYSLIGHYEPFWTLTVRALDYAMRRVPSVDAALKPKLLDAYRVLGAYPEAINVLCTLRERGVKTAVLSNGNASMLNTAFDGAGLTSFLDRLISVDDACVFKTSPKTYSLVTTAFDVSPSAVTFVSSNRWDVAGATAFGFQSVWVNRAKMPDEYSDFSPVRVVDDLRGVVPDL
jgi:2-haloacid dehalogenase